MLYRRYRTNHDLKGFPDINIQWKHTRGYIEIK